MRWDYCPFVVTGLVFRADKKGKGRGALCLHTKFSILLNDATLIRLKS